MSSDITFTERAMKMMRIDTLEPELRPGDEIDMLAREESHVGAVEQIIARYLQRNINETIDARAVQGELTEQKLAAHYDPSLPTVAFDATHALAGSELIGMSAARGTDKKINVVYIDTATCGLTYSESEHGATNCSAERVHIIDAQGRVLSGEVPGGMRIDAVESVDLELLSALNSVGVQTLSNPESMKRYMDKHLLDEVGEAAGIEVPVRRSLASLAEHDDVVIKPSNTSSGTGIYFSKHHDRTPEDWQRYYNYLEAKNYAPVIEDRVECWPLFDPKTGEKIDWNVRAIVSHGKVIDMYIRAGAEASAVNKSTGAKAIPMADLKHYLGDNPPASAQIIKSSLVDAAESLAHSMDDFVIGADLTINSRGEVVTFELNAGHVGGLQTITKIETGSKSKRLKQADAIVDEIAHRVSIVGSSEDGTEKQRLALTFGMKVGFLSSINMVDMYADSIDETAHSDVSSYSRTRVLLSRLRNAHMSMKGAEAIDALVREMMEMPFEANDYLGYIPALGSQALKGLVAEFTDADPHSKEAKIAQIYVAAHDCDLKTIYEVIRNNDSRELSKHAGFAISSFAKNLTRGLDLDASARVQLDEVLAAHLAVISLSSNSSFISQVNDILTETCRQVPNEFSYAVLSRVMALMGEYELAAGYLEQIDMHDEATIDYHLDTLNMFQENFLRDEAGQDFVATHFMGLGGAEALHFHKEKHGAVSKEAERVLGRFDSFLASEQPVRYSIKIDIEVEAS